MIDWSLMQLSRALFCIFRRAKENAEFFYSLVIPICINNSNKHRHAREGGHPVFARVELDFRVCENDRLSSGSIAFLNREGAKMDVRRRWHDVLNDASLTGQMASIGS